VEEHIDNTEQPAPRRKKQEGKNRSVRSKQIASFLVMIAGVMILLSLVSYSQADEANGDITFTGLFKIFSNDQVMRAKAGATGNWLGLVGAVLSNFLINSTIGYSIFFLPILLLLWGWVTLRQGDVRRLIYFTNYILLIGTVRISAVHRFVIGIFSRMVRRHRYVYFLRAAAINRIDRRHYYYDSNVVYCCHIGD
jgi:hypothetical protein